MYKSKETIKCPSCEHVYPDEITYELKEQGTNWYILMGGTSCPNCHTLTTIDKKHYIR